MRALHRECVRILYHRSVPQLVSLTNSQDISDWQAFLRRDGAQQVADALIYWLIQKRKNPHPSHKNLATFIHQYEFIRAEIKGIGWRFEEHSTRFGDSNKDNETQN